MSSGQWRSRRLRDIAAPDKYAIVGGPFGSKLVSADYVDEGVPVLRGANLPLDRRISLNDLVFVAEEKAEADLFGNLAHPGDIVVTQRGTLGQIGILPNQPESPYDRFVVSQSQMKLTVDPAVADKDFVYYALCSPASVKRIQDLGMSSGVPHINLEIFRNYEICLPDISSQRILADILCTYDDLIENNRRRIEILEGMARLLYREWFVHFRYPGHENVELVDSDVGLIPEDWVAVSLSDVCRVNRRSVRKGDDLGEILYLDISAVGPRLLGTPEPVEFTGAPGRARRVAVDGDTIWSTVRPNRRSHALVLDPAPNLICSTGFAVLSPEGVPSSFLFELSSSDPFITHLEALATGSAYPAVRPVDFEAYRFALAPDALMKDFDDVAAPVHRLQENLRRQNAVLREARDLLLPRLVSGELDVSELGLDLEAAGV